MNLDNSCFIVVHNMVGHTLLQMVQVVVHMVVEVVQMVVHMGLQVVRVFVQMVEQLAEVVVCHECKLPLFAVGCEILCNNKCKCKYILELQLWLK